MDDLLDGRLVDAATAVRSRAVSATELTRACLDRIAARDPAIGAFLHVEAEAAMAAAERADAAVREGAPLGPLHGVPVARKDLFDRAGQLCTAGAWIDRERRATATATVLARFDTAGAVDVGGLTLSEFAFHVHGANRLGGPPRNPWDRTRIAGGSSGGSAAALAARLVFGAMGSDSGGSIRSPAALCGVVGLVPTAGRVSRAGMTLSSPSLDVAGPMARCVRDAARLFDVVAGHDRTDPDTNPRGTPHAEARLDQPVGAVTVVVPPPRLLDGLSPAARAAVEDAAKTFRDFGWELTERDLPDLDALNALTAIVFLAEAAATHRDRLRTRADDFHPEVRDRLLPGLAIPEDQYRRALAARAAACTDFCATVFDGAHLLLLPSAPDVAPRFDDVIAVEGSERAVRSLATGADPGRFTRAINYLGLPALALPAGLSRAGPPDGGLPVGIQLVGRPFDEGLLLAAGHRFEEAAGFADRLPADLPSADPV